MCGGQHLGPRLESRGGFSGVDDSWSQEADTPVAVLLVVPLEEAAAEVEAVVVAGELAWEVGLTGQRPAKARTTLRISLIRLSRRLVGCRVPEVPETPKTDGVGKSVFRYIGVPPIDLKNRCSRY